MTQWKEEQVERRRLEIQLAEDREEFRKVSLQMQESFEMMQKQILQKPDAAHRQQIAAKEIEIELLKAKVAALEEKDMNSQKLLASFKVECDYATVEEPETSPARASSTRVVKISRQRKLMINQHAERMA